MNAINKFCKERRIPTTIESAFRAYIRTDYAQTFEMKDGDTIAKIVSNLTDEQVADAWNKFVLEFKNILP